MSSFNAQATVFGYTFEGPPNEITAHYLLQDTINLDYKGQATVSVAVSPGDTAHNIRQAVSAAILSNPNTSNLNGSIQIEYLV